MLRLVTGMLLVARDPFVCIPPTRRNPVAIIVFPGTLNARDLLLDDLDIRTVGWPKNVVKSERGMVHRGFARRTEGILRKMRSFTDTYDRFTLAGHSLGGAVAVLTAAHLSQTKSIESVYTFGMPNLGSTEFRKFYESNDLQHVSTHYTTPLDPIVHSLPGGFESVGSFSELPCSEENPWAHHDMMTYYAAFN